MRNHIIGILLVSALVRPALASPEAMVDEGAESAGFSSEQCTALIEFETNISPKSLDELKANFAVIKNAGEEDLSILQEAFGISKNTIALMKKQSPEENQGLFLTALSLVAVAHPELIVPLMEVGRYEGDIGDEMAQALMIGMANNIAAAYQKSCR